MALVRGRYAAAYKTARKAQTNPSQQGTTIQQVMEKMDDLDLSGYCIILISIPLCCQQSD